MNKAMDETKGKVTTDPKSIILDVIDQLRQRKARPDLVRISHMVQRKHGVSYQDTEAELERLVERNVVLKVDYKGDISYRNAAKWRKSHLGGNVLNAKSTSTRIMEALTALQNENENSLELESHSVERNGASMADIEKWIAENYTVSELTSNGPNDIIRNRLDVALQREVEIGHVVRLANGNYMMGNLKSHSNVQYSNGQSPEENGSSLSSNTSGGCFNTEVVKEKRARKKNRSFDPADFRLLSKKSKPNNKMKCKSRKVKDMINMDAAEVLPQVITMEIPKLQIQSSRNSSSQTSALSLKNVFDQKCDYCRQSSVRNPEGTSEELLICEDCDAKAHPSCMNYSRELARRALTSPWQCIDCKTCCICTDADDAAEMLFCDACDKGYHMKCNRPAITDKPIGKWVCNRCVYDVCGAPDDTGTEPHTTLSQVSSINDFNGNKLTVIKSIPLEFTMDQVIGWNIDEVVQYITGRGFSDQAEKFREQEIDGKSLLLMKRLDILTGMRMKLGPALKIHRDISRLQAQLYLA